MRQELSPIIALAIIGGLALLVCGVIAFTQDKLTIGCTLTLGGVVALWASYPIIKDWVNR